MQKVAIKTAIKNLTNSGQEFLGIWEEMYNPNFNSPEFEVIKKKE